MASTKKSKSPPPGKMINPTTGRFIDIKRYQKTMRARNPATSSGPLRRSPVFNQNEMRKLLGESPYPNANGWRMRSPSSVRGSPMSNMNSEGASPIRHVRVISPKASPKASPKVSPKTTYAKPSQAKPTRRQQATAALTKKSTPTRIVLQGPPTKMPDMVVPKPKRPRAIDVKGILKRPGKIRAVERAPVSNYTHMVQERLGKNIKKSTYRVHYPNWYDDQISTNIPNSQRFPKSPNSPKSPRSPSYPTRFIRTPMSPNK